MVISILKESITEGTNRHIIRTAINYLWLFIFYKDFSRLAWSKWSF